MTYTASGDPEKCTIDELLRLLSSRKYRGSVTFHFDNGRPLVAEYGRPSQVELVPRLNGAAASGAASTTHAHDVGAPEITLVGRPEA